MEPNWSGLIYGAIAFLAIGVGYPWVIKVEYHFGARAWRPVLALGALLLIGSVLVPGFTASAVVGIFGGSVIWGAQEVVEQEQRVLDGQYPINPARREHYEERPR
ncbi:MAG: DUF4491 family protein [Polyangia bacterium]